MQHRSPFPTSTPFFILPPQQAASIDAVIHKQEGTHKVLKLASQEAFSIRRCRPPFTRLAQHLTALRAWCKQYLPGR